VTRHAEFKTRKPERVLVCFALPEEAASFRRQLTGEVGLEILVTGMGARNAAQRTRAALEGNRPELVLTCGYAGGLDPALATGQVVFACDGPPALRARLQRAGAREVRFHCAARIVATAAEKWSLRLATGADAGEMESEAIHRLCQERGIPCATVRVISDTAEEDLPLDFNQVLTPDQRLDGPRLAAAILKAPSRIPGLLRLRKQTRLAGNALGQALAQILGGSR
jgi:adenosylhomocysteine nucleosidase